MPGFYQPVWLTGLLLLPFIWYLHQRSVKTRGYQALEFSQVAVARLAQNNRRASQKPLVLLCLLLLSIGLIFTGLAGPHIPLMQTREGVNVVLVMDISGSMQATDYTPTRIDAAKNAAEILLRQLDSRDYIGVVTFESGAMSAAYLSPDKDRVMTRLRAITARTGPTALGDGLALGIDMADSIPNRKKVVILLSDGVSNAGVITPGEAARFARERNVQVFVTGLGSLQPVPAARDLSGETTYATLDEGTLRTIANETGGKFFRSVDDQTLSAIYAGLNGEIVREPEETDIGIFFFIAAVCALLVEAVLRYGRGRVLP